MTKVTSKRLLKTIKAEKLETLSEQEWLFLIENSLKGNETSLQILIDTLIVNTQNVTLDNLNETSIKQEKSKKVVFDEDSFWGIVESMDYKKDLNYERIRKELKSGKYVSKENLNYFTSTFFQTKNALKLHIECVLGNDFEKFIGLGDDGFDDLVSHIIGLGKEHFLKCSHNMSLVSEHANGSFGTVDGYTESFSYILN